MQIIIPQASREIREEYAFCYIVTTGYSLFQPGHEDYVATRTATSEISRLDREEDAGPLDFSELLRGLATFGEKLRTFDRVLALEGDGLMIGPFGPPEAFAIRAKTWPRIPRVTVPREERMPRCRTCGHDRTHARVIRLSWPALRLMSEWDECEHCRQPITDHEWIEVNCGGLEVRCSLNTEGRTE